MNPRKRRERREKYISIMEEKRRTQMQLSDAHNVVSEVAEEKQKENVKEEVIEKEAEKEVESAPEPVAQPEETAHNDPMAEVETGSSEDGATTPEWDKKKKRKKSKGETSV